MSYELNAFHGSSNVTYNMINNEDLQQQLVLLTEWKNKAIVQLEYFRCACRLYNFCEVDKVNELLKADS